MPAAAEHYPKPPRTSPPAGYASAALAPAPITRGHLPLAAADDRSLLNDLLGASAVSAIRNTSVAELLEASPDQLARLGVKPAARRRLLAGAELARRFQPAVTPLRPVRSARDLLPHLRALRAARSAASCASPCAAACWAASPSWPRAASCTLQWRPGRSTRPPWSSAPPPSSWRTITRRGSPSQAPKTLRSPVSWAELA